MRKLQKKNNLKLCRKKCFLFIHKFTEIQLKIFSKIIFGPRKNALHTQKMI